MHPFYSINLITFKIEIRHTQKMHKCVVYKNVFKLEFIIWNCKMERGLTHRVLINIYISLWSYVSNKRRCLPTNPSIFSTWHFLKLFHFQFSFTDQSFFLFLSFLSFFLFLIHSFFSSVFHSIIIPSAKIAKEIFGRKYKL